MGIKNLWTVLTPFCDRRPLYELQGRTVAIDLSCWICEAQNIAEYQVQPRMYLRNLYFRTCYLLLMDVIPVFVLEGKAPELKFDTISARNAVQFKGAKPKTDGIKTGKDRTRFHFVLRQCEEMLGYMGLACIKGNGEAESLCAYLNEDGLVDGCISQDSDCFAYGAQVVYRNFSISTQGTTAASGGSVDVYDIRKANESLKFGRNKIIAMALLIGSDYSEGVHGVGKDSVLKFFETVSNEEVLDRLRSWRKNANMFEDYEKQLNDKNICTSCGHNGKLQSHTKNGCLLCKTTKGCDPFKYKEQRLKIRNEVNIRNKAMQDPNFPNEVLINEFLHRKDNVKQLDLTWKQPNLVKFIKFVTKFLQWEELYAFEKILPVLTRWQCRNHELLKNEGSLNGVLKPERIKKIRNPKGVASYEIIWSDPDGYFKGLIPQHQLQDNNVDPEKLCSSIEPQHLVERTYPDLVEAFKQSKIKPKKVKRRKKNDALDGLTEQLENISITKAEMKKTKKPKCMSKQSVKQLSDEASSSKKKVRTLDNFVKKAVMNSYNEKSSTPLKPKEKNPPFDLDASRFGDESDLDLSDVIDDMISKKAFLNTAKEIAAKYVACDVLNCSDEEIEEPKEHMINRSSFFMQNINECDDGFEKVFNQTFKRFDSGSDTEEYELIGDDEIVEKYQNDQKEDSDEDSFCTDVYIPLHERLNRRHVIDF